MPDDTASRILVRASGVHGLGAFAARALRRGQRIGSYAGRRIPAGAEQDWNPALTYLFGLSDGSMIDGGAGGNATRHLNHSCAPNCQAWEVTRANGRIDVVIETLRPIAAGEELFIDYALQADADADPAHFACHCGAPACRGTLLAPAEPEPPRA